MEEDYSRPKLIKFHSLEAKKLAIDLQALHSNIFPHELSGEYAEAATDKLLPFAFHARRLLELTSLQVGEVTSKQTIFEGMLEPDKSMLSWNFDHFLNYLIHCTSYQISIGNWAGEKVWANSDRNSYVSHVLVRTDRFGNATFYPFAMVTHFLTQIAPNQGLIPLNLGGQPGDVFQ